VVESRQIRCRSHCWMTAADGRQRWSIGAQPAVQLPVASSQTGWFDGQAAWSSQAVPGALHFCGTPVVLQRTAPP
jgi:hypothetical protein